MGTFSADITEWKTKLYTDQLRDCTEEEKRGRTLNWLQSEIEERLDDFLL